MDFTPEQITALLAALGLATDTDDAQLVVDTITDLAAQVQALDPEKPSTVHAAAARNGMVVLDKETDAALRRDAQAGRQAAAAAAAAQVEAAVDAAIDKGKVMASRRKHWITLCTSDPEMVTHLASIAPGTAVPLDEVGHAAGTGDIDQPAGWFW